MIYWKSETKYLIIPTNSTKIDNEYKLSIYNLVTNAEFEFNVTDLTDNIFYFKFDVENLDFSTLPVGEYEYKITKIDENNEYGCGLLIVGNYYKLNTQYQTNNEKIEYSR